MMIEEIDQLLFDAIDEVNQLQQKSEHLHKSIETVLFGGSGKLDSMGLINFIVIIEEKIDEQYGIKISLADESIMSQENNPFNTIGTLSEYIFRLLEKKNNG